MRPVIIADADPALRRSIRRALGALHRRVLECRTSIDALVALEAERGTMLVLGPSLTCPGAGEVIDLIRASRAWAALGIVCVVAAGDGADARALMERGASACIESPPGAHGAAIFKRLLAECAEPDSSGTLEDALAALREPSLAEIVASAVRFAVGVTAGQELIVDAAPAIAPSDGIGVSLALTPRVASGRAIPDDATRSLELVASAAELRAMASAHDASDAPADPRALLERLASIVAARVIAALAERGLSLVSGPATEMRLDSERAIPDEIRLVTERGSRIGARVAVRRPVASAPPPGDGGGGSGDGRPKEITPAPRPRIALAPAPKVPLLGA